MGPLIEHFFSGENYDKSEKYSRLAGKIYLKTGSLNDAIFYCGKRIACLEKLTQTEEVQKKIIDTRTVLGVYYAQLNYHIKAKEAVEPIVDLAIRHNYQNRLSQIYTILGVYVFVFEEDFDKAIQKFQGCFKIVNGIVAGYPLYFYCELLVWISTLAMECDFEKGPCSFRKSIKDQFGSEH